LQELQGDPGKYQNSDILEDFPRRRPPVTIFLERPADRRLFPYFSELFSAAFLDSDAALEAC